MLGILSFISRKPLIGALMVTLISGLLFSSISGAAGYLKGRSDGRALANSVCTSEKIKAAEDHLETRKDLDEIKNNRLDTDGLFDSLFRNKF